jgi:hypothetical protein
MHRLPFNISNNWDEHPELQRHIEWRRESGVEGRVIFEALVGTDRWTVRLNDFPDEPLYSLLIGSEEVFHFDNWPEIWGSRPSLPEKRD